MIGEEAGSSFRERAPTWERLEREGETLTTQKALEKGRSAGGWKKIESGNLHGKRSFSLS